MCSIRTLLIDLFASVWNSGGGDKPKLWNVVLPRDCKQFQAKFDEIQAQLQY